MDIKYNHEKILIIVALVLCAGILFYNAFFIPEISIPSVIYVNSENVHESSSDDDTNINPNTNVNPDTNIDPNTNINSNINPNTNINSNINPNTNIDPNTNINSNTEEENNNKPLNKTKININTATEAELAENLTGVGPVTAKKIVEYRTTVGKFSTIDDIKNVSGIGNKTFEKFKDIICV